MTAPRTTPLPAVRRLDDVRSADAPEVGGKAASLGELLASGVRVPPGVVLIVGAAGLDEAEWTSLLRDGVAELGNGPFAVRSSGITEDGADHSYAGMYESVLGVTTDGLSAAADRVLSSAQSARVAGYQADVNGDIAVIVQRMVQPTAAGVAMTADPVSGDRETTVVTAIRGTGERLVSGEAIGDEWAVRDGAATAWRQPEHALDAGQARAVAAEARRIADARGGPQDIEWAIDSEGALWILQARPMTALPPQVSWEPPVPGGYARGLRLGEWISAPVTPLFESWLLTVMEASFHRSLHREIGQRFPRPHHVVVNGWYYYSIAWFSPGSLLRSLPGMAARFVREPRKLAGIAPATARYTVPVLEPRWRQDMQPRYRSAVASAEADIDGRPVNHLPPLIDELAELAGEYFMWIAALGGAAYKLELTLASFYRKHLSPTLGGSHLPLLAGIEPPADPGPHAVASLDWWYRPGLVTDDVAPSVDHAAVVRAREAAERAATEVLRSNPRRLRSFQRLLAETQHLAPIREEQARELTLGWPVMRRAVLRIGQALRERGLLDQEDDVFFLTRSEVLAALDGGSLGAGVDVAARRAARDEQGRLVPPPIVGRMPPMVAKVVDAYTRTVGGVRSDTALVAGTPASPGRATGTVRVIHGPEQFDDLLSGEILVAPITAPAWTPLFTRAAAVVTDVGSAAAHASIIAREYGIPAVVGCGDATARLRTGMAVTVDGSTGNVEPA